MPIEPGPSYVAKKLDGGLITRFPAHTLQDHQSPNAQNFDPTETGAAKKRKGYIKFTSAAKVTPTGTFVSGLFSGTFSSGTTKTVATEGTALHDISAGSWATTISGATITVDTMVSMTMFEDLIIICNTGGGPYKWTGSGAAAALAGTPPANAKYTAVHRNRLWLAGPGKDYAAGTTDASRVNFSGLGDAELWDHSATPDNPGSIGINTGDGFIVNGICSGGDFLLVSKISQDASAQEGALYAIFGSSPYDFAVKKILGSPAVSHQAMVQYDNFVCVATSRGIYAINGRNIARVDDPVLPTYRDITNKGTICGGKYKQTVRFAYPASGSQNNRELILDVERGVWGLNTGKTVRIYSNHPDGRLLVGTSGTSILVWEEENGNNDDGSNINFFWETPDFDFEEPAFTKRLTSTHIHADTSPTTTLTIDHYINGTDQTFAKTMATNTEGPVKRFPMGGAIGKFHRMRVTDNSSNGQTKVYGVSTWGELYQPGFP